ncbi:YczE/YyaS/YitT family protein [Aquibacillus salsiterrae]|uniref:YitT family protein n=1 Tax=Aquibacillus salsiterrae TaxID=2950439 RepID=A0A9X3WDP3_9BACI|nr:YitT family protein [Aquibacillus salsiterrae]MDC3416205.1 YitT family protein [Aquibacillus salsiterrae]
MRWIREGFLFYVTGILIFTLGIALTILSKLGASPFDALLVGLHRTFGLTIGSFEVVVGLTMVVGNAFAQKKAPEYLALLTSLITGLGIDMWIFLLNSIIVPSSYFTKWIALIIGITLIAIGVATYLQSKFAPNPMDRSMLVISELTGMSVTYSRALISIALVILAYFFDGAIGIGTIINALFTGMFIKWFMPYIAIFKNEVIKRKDPYAS